MWGRGGGCLALFLDGSITGIGINCKSNYAQIGRDICRMPWHYTTWRGCNCRSCNYATYAFFMARKLSSPQLDKKKKCQQSNETVAQIADNFCKTWANICGRGNRSDSSTTNRSWNLCEGTIHNKTHTHTHTRICQLSTSIMSTHGFSTTIFEHNYEKRFSRTTPRRHLEVWVVPGWLGERGWAWLGHQGLHGTR